MFNVLKREIKYLESRCESLNEYWSDDGKNILDFYVKIIPKVVNAERCSIFIHDPASKKIWLKSGSELKERDIEVDKEGSIVGNVIKTGNIFNQSGLEQQEGIHKQFDDSTGFVTHEILCVPITTPDGKEITGAIELLNKIGEGGFNKEDEALVNELSYYLELGVQNLFFSQKATKLSNKLYRMFINLAITSVAFMGLVFVLLFLYLGVVNVVPIIGN